MLALVSPGVPRSLRVGVVGLTALVYTLAELGGRPVYGYVHLLSFGQCLHGRRLPVLGRRKAVDELQRLCNCTGRCPEPWRC